MDHEHWTVRDDASRPTFWPVVAFLGAAALLIAIVLLIVARSDSSVEGPGLGDIALERPATTTTSPTTVAPTTVAPTTAPALPAATIPPPTEATVDVIAAPLGDAEGALEALARSVMAGDVTPPVQKSAGTFAVVTVAGSARLYEWDGEQWHERRAIDAPAPVQAVTAIDVTGDGTSDFVIQMGGAGGVYNPRAGGWGWLPFVGPDGSTDVVEGLQSQPGRLRSGLVDAAGQHQVVEWHWDGTAFTIR